MKDEEPMKQGTETGGTCFAESCSKPALTYVMGEGVIRGGQHVGCLAANLCDDHRSITYLAHMSRRMANAIGD